MFLSNVSLSLTCLLLTYLIFVTNSKNTYKSICRKDLMDSQNTFYELSKFSIGSYGGNISIKVKLNRIYNSTEKLILIDLVQSNKLEVYKDTQSKIPEQSMISQRLIIKFPQPKLSQVEFAKIGAQQQIIGKLKPFREYYLMLKTNLPYKLDLLSSLIVQNNYNVQFQITWLNGQSHVGQGQQIIHIYFIIIVVALFLIQNQAKLLHWRYRLVEEVFIYAIMATVVEYLAKIINALIYIQTGMYNQLCNKVFNIFANSCVVVKQIALMFSAFWWMSEQFRTDIRRKAIKNREYIPEYQQQQPQDSCLQFVCRLLFVITIIILVFAKFIYKMMQQEYNQNFSQQKYLLAIKLIIFLFFGSHFIKRIKKNQFNDKSMLKKILIITLLYAVTEWIIIIMVRKFANKISYLQYDTLIIQITQLILIKYIWKLLIRHAEQNQIFNNASNDQNKLKKRNQPHND